jgi:hypothetical protein
MRELKAGVLPAAARTRSRSESSLKSDFLSVKKGDRVTYGVDVLSLTFYMDPVTLKRAVLYCGANGYA